MQSLENYFDYAAATPVLPEAAAAMQPFFHDKFYNPSALYLAARDNRLALDDIRHEFAKSIGARPTEIIFTAGGTEANNLVIHGILNQYPEANIVTSAIEHESVLRPANEYDCTVIGVSKAGVIDTAELAKAITDKTVLVSVMYVNNEIGTIQPIQDVVEIVKEVRQQRVLAGNSLPIYVHTDACQAGNYLDVHVSRLGVDMMTINSGKVYGPKQTGALYVKAGIVLQPQILGGGQEWGIRSGTENMANIAGFVTAWLKARHNAQSEAKRLSHLRQLFISELETALPDSHINGANGNRRIANNIHLTIPNIDNERLLMQLDELGFQIATGSACSASNDEPSHVLMAIGLSDNEARSSVRITLGRYTTEASIKLLLKNIIKTVALS